MSTLSNQSTHSFHSMSYSPRITLIGCGAIAEGYYLPALAKEPQILNSLTLVDQNLERAKKLSETFNVKRCLADYREALDESDGVIIALPTHLHHPVSMAFLSKGIPVFCEKPLAESADKAREMVNQAKKKGVVLAANYQQRLWPNFAKAKEIIDERILGEPVCIKYYVGEVFAWPTVSGFYFNSTNSGRGVLRDRGAHVLDHICWWLGGKPQVKCSQNDSLGGSDAGAQVQFEYNHCVGEVKLSWLSSFPCKFIIECEKGSIEGEIYYPQNIYVKKGAGSAKQVKLNFEGYSALGYKMVDNFIKAITIGEKPLVSGSDVLDSVEFIDDCYAAATRFDMPWYEISEVKRG